MTLKRSAMKPGKPLERKTPLRASIAQPKPPKGPKPKKCTNRACRALYLPDLKQPWKNWCSDDCALVIALEKLAKQKAAKATSERAEDRKRKRELTSPTKLAEPVRKLAQRYAVLRDHKYGCISCDKGPHWTGGDWHGGHWKTVGSNSALQFNLLNINKQCDQCNFFKAGAATAYETRLRQKIGDENVNWLKNHTRSREYTHEYLDRLAVVLRKKIRRLEKLLGLRK